MLQLFVLLEFGFFRVSVEHELSLLVDELVEDNCEDSASEWQDRVEPNPL